MTPKVQLLRTAYFWQSGMAINADGSPRAYAPAGSGLVALDNLANAGRPGNWWALACNNDGAPYIQGTSHPHPGYYVSTTALVDRSKPAGDPARYVDSEKVPYVVVPPDLTGQRGVRMGDLAMVLYQGRRCGAVVADIGPHGHYGEGSIALADALQMPSSPKHGGAAWGVTFLIWPGKPAVWPCPNDAIATLAEQLFAAWGGEAALQQETV